MSSACKIHDKFSTTNSLMDYQNVIAKDRTTHGAMFVPIVARSNKMTVSVATGNQEYHPVYMSPGNLLNTAWQAHSNTLLPVAFLPIPKSKLGPYIADYPEQVWLAAIVQGWCPKCDALPHNLDCKGAHQRSKKKSEFLVIWATVVICLVRLAFTAVDGVLGTSVSFSPLQSPWSSVTQGPFTAPVKTFLIDTWDPAALWTVFGIHADIVIYSRSPIPSLGQTSITFYHQIYFIKSSRACLKIT
ncbi:hypothetical protein BGW80DRAFT_1250159 [Lactifluus volemus]|nr:hypothetical protein BGW80DRAFT_1250159 [Lactifluus volemus]